jgi:hypothetical protein
VKPPTATARLLSIDGGGARGIIPLVFLQALEEKIGLQYPVQENFHYAIGTSSGQSSYEKHGKCCKKLIPFAGGISVLVMYINGWSVEDCIDYFKRLAKQAFE